MLQPLIAKFLLLRAAEAQHEARLPQCWEIPDHIQLGTQQLGLLWTSDQPVAVAATYTNTTNTRDELPCTQQGSNPQSQQASGRRPTP